jgi:hypothetical protein
MISQEQLLLTKLLERYNQSHSPTLDWIPWNTSVFFSLFIKNKPRKFPLLIALDTPGSQVYVSDNPDFQPHPLKESQIFELNKPNSNQLIFSFLQDYFNRID